MSDEATDTDADEARTEETDHLSAVSDGCGCAEVWEHASEVRED